MTQTILPLAIVPALDEPTVTLVRLAGAVAAGSEAEMRRAVADATRIDPVWVEELILQSYLFAGFPRTLNAMREWRKASGRAAPEADGRAEVEREKLGAVVISSASGREFAARDGTRCHRAGPERKVFPA